MYEEFFALNEPPFRTSPDPRFLYLAEQTKEVLAKCLYMAQNRIGPVFTTGPIGSGKTSVARRLYQQLEDDDRYLIAMLIAPNLRTANAFLRTIMNEFEVKTARSYDRSLANFAQWLKERYRKGKIPVLIVDEAQNLNTDMLRLVHFLLNYETNTEKLLQILLFGQVELLTKIESFPELKSRMFPAALAAFTHDDTEKMIAFRWQVAGGNALPFSKDALELIFRRSLGLPREVVKICDMALLQAFSDQAKTVGPQTIDQVAKELYLERQKRQTKKTKK
jgi:general secretion pathway protein A